VYFDVKATSISQKAFDIEFYIDGMKKNLMKNEVYEFIDIDRFEVNELYWEFIESSDADDVKKSIKILKKIIKQDKDYFDPYISLYEYYIYDKDFKNAINTMELGFQRAIDLIDNNGRFPDEFPWGFIENRHIIRMIFNFAIFVWENEDTDMALKILLELLKSNTNDNIGARHSIIAILEGFKSQDEFEKKFESEDGMSLKYMEVEEWFFKVSKKHKGIIGWWFNIIEE